MHRKIHRPFVTYEESWIVRQSFAACFLDRPPSFVAPRTPVRPPRSPDPSRGSVTRNSLAKKRRGHRTAGIRGRSCSEGSGADLRSSPRSARDSSAGTRRPGDRDLAEPRNLGSRCGRIHRVGSVTKQPSAALSRWRYADEVPKPGQAELPALHLSESQPGARSPPASLVSRTARPSTPPIRYLLRIRSGKPGSRVTAHDSKAKGCSRAIFRADATSCGMPSVGIRIPFMKLVRIRSIAKDEMSIPTHRRLSL